MATDELIQQGISALKSGDRALACKLLLDSIRVQPNNEMAWLWLSGAVSSDQERRYCLEQVLSINPQSNPAIRGLAILPKDMPSKSPIINTQEQPSIPINEPLSLESQSIVASYSLPETSQLQSMPKKKRKNWLLPVSIILSTIIIVAGIIFVIPILAKPNLSKINLESILIQPGDLPAGITGGQVSEMSDRMDSKYPKPTNNVYQELSENGKQIGEIVILLYDSDIDLNQVFSMITSRFPEIPQTPVDIGNKGVAFSGIRKVRVLDMESSVRVSSVVFTRCGAIAQITIVDSYAITPVKNYAQRLDQRITPLVCAWNPLANK